MSSLRPPLAQLEFQGRSGRKVESPGHRSPRDSDDLANAVAAEFPLLPLRNVVVFPQMVSPLMVGRDQSLRAVEAAAQADNVLLVVTQRDAEKTEPELDDLYTMGTEFHIGRVMRTPDGTTHLLGQGQHRMQIVDLVHSHPYIRVRAIPIYEETVSSPAIEALKRAALGLFERCVNLSPYLPEEAYVAAMNADEPGVLADVIGSSLGMEADRRQEILEVVDPVLRLQRLTILLGKELDVLEMESRISAQVQQSMDRSQREYFLREQLQAIQRELGEGDAQNQELNDLREKITAARMSETAQAKADKELGRLKSTPSSSPEAAVIRTYLDWLVELPWHQSSDDNMDIAHAESVLEDHHFGLPKAKDRVLEHIAVRQLAQDRMRSPILCFVGPPGTGKTSMGRSIAKALGREFVRISLGGIRDEAEIRGHRRTYIGALPGRIIQTMRNGGTINPVFMLDEVDKIGMDFRGDPSAALLEVLDPEQNSAFSDHYLDVPYNLSKVMFITTANVLDTVPRALEDRMEVISFPGYTEEEKVQIARKFLIPKQLNEHGLEEQGLRFTDRALQRLIREYTYESGVRNLERSVANICRKIARRVAEGKPMPQRVGAQSLAQHLGPPRFARSLAQEEDEVGVATGLAWTEGGGDLTIVEASAMDGKGNTTLTGQLGEVMQESAQAALSYARAHSHEFGFADIEFDRIDIHIHLPEGAIPKDGPSAGITLATALISELRGVPIRRDVAMTGEITLRGRVLAVGGIKEKLLTAHRAGLKTVLIPKKNKRDLTEIPARVRRDLDIVLVERMEEVLAHALRDTAAADQDSEGMAVAPQQSVKGNT